MSITNKNSIEQEEIVGPKAEVETWKPGFCKKKLQTIKNLSVFGLKLFFFIEAFLKKAR